MFLKINKKILFSSILCITLMSSFAKESIAAKFTEKIPVFGVIKPTEMTTAISVNHGMVAKVHGDVGDSVKPGSVLLTAIEKETTRTYRSTIKGKLAKLHVTRGATLTPGVPLVTVINPEMKRLEVSLSPSEATFIKVGSEVFKQNNPAVFGHVNKVSPLVDPDSGAVLSYIKPVKAMVELVGDVIALEIVKRTIDDCLIKPINEIDKYSSEYSVEATSGVEACLLPKKK